MDVRFPIFIDLTDNNCTIIGGGEYAAACADMLLGFGAKVTVISPVINARLAELEEQKRIRYIPRKFFRGDCANAYLCIAATDSEQINIAVSVECKSRGIPVNVKAPSAYGTFRLPAAVICEDVTVAAYSEEINQHALENLRANLKEELPNMWQNAKDAASN
ncbi:MAG: hypothetical protein IJC17_06715 [Clostridia bacterium]|nr:hypothetical protein [Clostridia bacterium]